MISTGAITKRANEEQLPAQTIERDYVLAPSATSRGAADAISQVCSLLPACSPDDRGAAYRTVRSFSCAAQRIPVASPAAMSAPRRSVMPLCVSARARLVCGECVPAWKTARRSDPGQLL